MKQITCPHCGDTYPDFDVAHVCSRGPYAPKLKPKMNERIHDLAMLARKHFPKTETSGEFWVLDEEKFAELIVRECVEQIIIRERADGEWYQDDIFKHFGVEE